MNMGMETILRISPLVVGEAQNKICPGWIFAAYILLNIFLDKCPEYWTNVDFCFDNILFAPLRGQKIGMPGELQPEK
jgi:hypothetical protein